jgi:DMSO/TMAO reductase YedYZ molybdopterin-dependent catalytic subunit
MMDGSKKLSRRAFLARAGGSVVSISLPGVFVKLLARESSALAAQIRPDGRPRIPPGQQAVKRLYDMGGIQSKADLQDWRLRIHGKVEKPTILTFQQLIELTQIELTCDVHCVTGWTLLDSEWSGVRLSTIMDLVKLRQDARFVIFEAAAGYTSNIPMVEAQKKNVILAHSFFGKSLSTPHGAPVRALVPDRYFYKSAKWLEGVKFTAEDEPGYWESRGYSISADPWKEERFQKESR